MKLEVKKFGNSKMIILPKHYVKYMNIEEGDWLDIADAVLTKSKEDKNGKRIR